MSNALMAAIASCLHPVPASASTSKWHAALDNVATAQARALWIGDSIFEGTGSTTRVNRSQHTVLTDLVANHPVSGYGENKYLPQHFGMPANSTTPWGDGWYDSKTGTVAERNGGIEGQSGTTANTYGLGMRSAAMSTGAILTYTVHGTDVDVWTNSGGSCAVSIDGGAYSSTFSASNTKADIHSFSLGASGSHTVAVKAVSGSLDFLGLTVFDGGRDKGVATFDYCHYSASATDFYDAGDAALNATFERNLTLVDPQLVMIFLGANDANHYTPSQMIDNFDNMVASIRSTVPDADLIFVQVYNQTTPDATSSSGHTAQEYRDAIDDFVAAQNIPILKLSSQMPNVYDDTLGYYHSDGEHCTDLGHAFMADLIGGFIDPLHTYSTMTLNGTLPSAAVGTAYSHDLLLSGAYTGPVSFSGQPAWMSLSNSSGTVTATGTPTTSGTDSGTITVTDADGQTTALSYSISVAAAPTVGVGVAASCNGAGAATSGVATQTTGSSFAVVTGEYRDGGFSGVPQISPPTDNKGNTYTLVTSAVAGPYRAALWLCADGDGGAGHAWTNHDTKPYATLTACEVKDGAASPLDGYNTGFDSGSGPYTSGSITTTHADDLLLGFGVYDFSSSNSGITAVASGYTLVHDTPTSDDICSGAWSRNVTTTGTYTTSFSSSSAAVGITILAAFKSA